MGVRTVCASMILLCSVVLRPAQAQQHPEPWTVELSVVGLSQVQADRIVLDNYGCDSGCQIKILATVKDLYGIPVPNADIVFAPVIPHQGSIPFANGVNIQAQSTTNSGGEAIAYVASSSSGSANIKATVQAIWDTWDSPPYATFFVGGSYSLNFDHSTGSGNVTLTLDEEEPGTLATVEINDTWTEGAVVLDGSQWANTETTAYAPADTTYSAACTGQASVIATYNVSWTSDDGWSSTAPPGYLFSGEKSRYASATHAYCGGTSSAMADSTSASAMCTMSDEHSGWTKAMAPRSTPGTITVTVASSSASSSIGDGGGSGTVAGTAISENIANAWQDHRHYNTPN